MSCGMGMHCQWKLIICTCWSLRRDLRTACRCTHPSLSPIIKLLRKSDYQIVCTWSTVVIVLTLFWLPWKTTNNYQPVDCILYAIHCWPGVGWVGLRCHNHDLPGGYGWPHPHWWHILPCVAWDTSRWQLERSQVKIITTAHSRKPRTLA